MTAAREPTRPPVAVHEPIQATPTHPVRVPVMRSAWTELAYLHWRYPVDEVQRLLPEGLHVDVAEGSAWVGLVPFRIGVGLPFGGPLLRFPETNVRTYVVGPDGGRGVYFFSLDATNLPAVLTARATYRLPYFWSSMTIDRVDDVVTYTCRRRWPEPGRGVRSTVKLRLGDRLPTDEVTDLDHFLSDRWSLYSPWGARIARGHMDHGRWPLAAAELLELHDELVAASGLPAPEGAPLVRHAAGVDVRVDRPRLLPPV